MTRPVGHLWVTNMMHRTVLMFFMSLLLTACDRHEEYFVSGSFTQTKPGCHSLSGLDNKYIRSCDPAQIKISNIMYYTFLAKRERYVALVVNDEKGAAITVWVSERELSGIGTVTVNIRTEKTTLGKLDDIAPYLYGIAPYLYGIVPYLLGIVPYLLGIAAVIVIFVIKNPLIKSKVFRLKSLGCTFGILAAIGALLVSTLIVQRFTTAENSWRVVHIFLFGPLLGWLAFIGVNGHFSDLAGKLCPKCNGTDTAEKCSSSYSYEGTETKTRRVTHFNKNDEETGYSEEEYEVPATFTRTTNFMRCKACKHEWTI